MKVLRMLVVMAVLAAACSGSGRDNKPAGTYPTGTVREWLLAVSGRDVPRLVDIVDQDSLAIILAIENSIPAEDVEIMLVQGISEETVADYWVSFAGGFGTYTGLALDSVTVRGFEQFAIDETLFAHVEVGDELDPGTVFTRSYDGTWRIDLVATFGEALLPLIEAFASEIPAGADGKRLRREVREAVIPALLAVDSLKPTVDRLGAEIGRLSVLLQP